MRSGNDWRRRQAPLSGSGEPDAVSRVWRQTDAGRARLPGRCRDKRQVKEEDVYIGIGTVLAIIVIILLLIWIF